VDPCTYFNYLTYIRKFTLWVLLSETPQHGNLIPTSLSTYLTQIPCQTHNSLSSFSISTSHQWRSFLTLPVLRSSPLNKPLHPKVPYSLTPPPPPRALPAMLGHHPHQHHIQRDSQRQWSLSSQKLTLWWTGPGGDRSGQWVLALLVALSRWCMPVHHGMILIGLGWCFGRAHASLMSSLWLELWPTKWLQLSASKMLTYFTNLYICNLQFIFNIHDSMLINALNTY
jgi:hypothetical protein